MNIMDARGHIVVSSEKELVDETMGENIVLSIDRTIQYIAEKELLQGVDKWNASGGFALVVAPNTGEILAMAQIPTFDPNHYNKYTKDHYQNRNVTVAVEPGSTFKIFTVAAALDAKVVKPTDKYHCENGTYSLGSAGVIHDVHPYGGLTVAEIIKKSSNIGAAKIGLKLGPQKMAHYLKGFGFGQRTGINYAGKIMAWCAISTPVVPSSTESPCRLDRASPPRLCKWPWPCRPWPMMASSCSPCS